MNRVNLKKAVKIVVGVTLLLISTVWFGCGKNINVKWMYYAETQCADRWTMTNNNEVLKDNITNYFQSKGVKILELEIFRNGDPEPCNECACKSGRTIKVKVKKHDSDDMKAEGFHD